MGARTGRGCDCGYPRFFGLIEGELLAFAEHSFALSKPDKNGVSKREHLETIQAKHGIEMEGLIGPPFPDIVEYVWSAFNSLHAGRGYGFSGPNPLSYENIAAWMSLTGIELSAWELDVVKRLDALWLKAMSEDK